MPLKRFALSATLPLILTATLVSGCGSSTQTASTQTSSTTSASSAGSSVTASTNAAASCPTDNTQAFPKVRFATNIGLATGAFHRWVWKPYQAGTFTQGAEGRTTALVKAGLATAFSAKQLNDAKNNVKADPQLCKIFAQPLADLTTQFEALKDKVAKGDMTAIEDTNKRVADLKETSKANGMPITDDENAPIG